MHLDLAERVAGARGVFLQAHLTQVFARRVHLRLLNIEPELFHPVLDAPADEARVVAEAFGDRVLGLRVPRLLHLDGLVDMLLAPPRTAEPDDVEPETPGEVEGVDLQAYPPAVVAEATRILRRASDRPVALSSLLSSLDPTASGDDVRELVLLTALWSYAPDVTDPEEDLTALVSALSAERSGDRLEHPLAWGDDLLVSYEGGLEA
ncbi:hypothetical protein [Dactylosporangium cerinum]